MNSSFSPDWYTEFLVALLRQAPRPPELDYTLAQGWTDNQQQLKGVLADSLLPPTPAPVCRRIPQDPLVPPQGTRLYAVRISAPQSSWFVAIRSAGPDTDTDHLVFVVEKLFLPDHREIITEDIVLLNYPQGTGSMRAACAWATGQGLAMTSPQSLFVLGSTHEHLNRELEVTRATVCGTMGMCIADQLLVPAVVWNRNHREVTLCPGIFGRKDRWFAFRQCDVL